MSAINIVAVLLTLVVAFIAIFIFCIWMGRFGAHLENKRREEAVEARRRLQERRLRVDSLGEFVVFWWEIDDERVVPFVTLEDAWSVFVAQKLRPLTVEEVRRYHQTQYRQHAVSPVSAAGAYYRITWKLSLVEASQYGTKVGWIGQHVRFVYKKKE